MIRKMMMMDWRAMKYYQIRGLLLPLFVCFIGFFSSPLLVIPTSVIMFLFFSLNPFAMEEKGELNNLYLTLPIRRADVVYGRFLLSGVMGTSGVVMGIPLMILVNRFGWSYYSLPVSGYFFVVAFSYLFYSIGLLATYPIFFKLGYNKGKFWGLVIPAILMGVLYGLFAALNYLPGNEMKMLELLEYASQNLLLTSGITILAATLLMVIAIKLSKSIYAKRDF